MADNSKKIERTVTFDFSGSITLNESDIWPDHSAPEGWTAADVMALMERGWLRRWNMDDCVTTTVTADDGTSDETTDV